MQYTQTLQGYILDKDNDGSLYKFIYIDKMD